MSAVHPLIICKQNILKHMLSTFIAKKVNEIHVFEYLTAKFLCFWVLSGTAASFIKKTFFGNINKTERHLVLLGGE